MMSPLTSSFLGEFDSMLSFTLSNKLMLKFYCFVIYEYTLPLIKKEKNCNFENLNIDFTGFGPSARSLSPVTTPKTGR